MSEVGMSERVEDDRLGMSTMVIERVRMMGRTKLY